MLHIRYSFYFLFKLSYIFLLARMNLELLSKQFPRSVHVFIIEDYGP